jgi:hypothetical protein
MPQPVPPRFAIKQFTGYAVSQGFFGQQPYPNGVENWRNYATETITRNQSNTISSGNSIVENTSYGGNEITTKEWTDDLLIFVQNDLILPRAVVEKSCSGSGYYTYSRTINGVLFDSVDWSATHSDPPGCVWNVVNHTYDKTPQPGQPENTTETYTRLSPFFGNGNNDITTDYTYGNSTTWEEWRDKTRPRVIAAVSEKIPNDPYGEAEDQYLWPSSSYIASEPSRAGILGAVSIDINLFRIRVNASHTGSKFYVTYDLVDYPQDPEEEPSFHSQDNTVEWTGPGNQADHTDDSWYTGWITIPPPSTPGTRKVVNIRYTHHSGERYGSKPSVTGIAYPEEE